MSRASQPRQPRLVSGGQLLAAIGALTALVLAVGLGLLIAVGAGNRPLAIDEAWFEWMLAHRSLAFDAPALLLNWLGGGLLGALLIPLAIVLALLLWRRPWAALYYGLAAAASAGLVQLLKGLLGRPRPDDIMVLVDAGSFPSGHVANAATVAVTLGIILARGWVWAAGLAGTVLMMLSRTYLGAHWLSDTVGGLLLGVGVALLVWVPLAGRLRRERRPMLRNARPAQ